MDLILSFALHIQSADLYKCAIFQAVFRGKRDQVGHTAPPCMGRKRWEVGWTQIAYGCYWGGTAQIALPYHSILPLRSIWSIQILFSHAFSIECIWLIQLWWGVWWDMGPTRGSGCAHRGRDPFPKHNHSSVSLFGYFSFWLLQCPITRHRTKQQIKTRSLGTGCGDIFGGRAVDRKKSWWWNLKIKLFFRVFITGFF